MGFLSINGYIMTYAEYKKHIKCYKKAGLLQYVQLYKRHKDRFIQAEHLHWGEEIEYQLYSFDEESNFVMLSCDAP